MRILKISWALFILLNIYDVIISAIYWLKVGTTFEENYFIWYYYYYHEWNIPFTLALLMLISIKLLFFTGVYWYTRLFDLFKVGKYKWLSLLPFVVLSILIDTQNTFILLSTF